MDRAATISNEGFGLSLYVSYKVKPILSFGPWWNPAIIVILNVSLSLLLLATRVAMLSVQI